MSKQTQPLSVTELTAEIRFNLSNQFSNIYVGGEISGMTRASSGHLYFTLKDATAQINAIIWRSDAERISRVHKFEIKNGIEFICRGSVDVYPQRGTYQLIIRELQPIGMGAHELAFKQLHEKLSAEGLFDPSHKQPLPTFPQHIVVITSPSGAAIRDFLQVLNRRWPNLRVTIVPAKVQGAGSANEIAAAIRSVSKFAGPPDVVVVTRGGGSVEDLWSFNEEPVVRAIFDCPIPVVSGVGHEIDVTLTDLVADVRALTPSEAAERLVPDQHELQLELNQYGGRMSNTIWQRLRFAKQQLRVVTNHSALTRPLQAIHDEALALDRLEEQLVRSMRDRTSERKLIFRELASRFESINPLAVLIRGYSVTTNSTGRIVNDSSQAEIGSEITTRLKIGQLVSTVISRT